MKVLYFIVCLLLVACSGDNQPEVNQPFELKNIIVGDQQNQQTFENVASQCSHCFGVLGCCR